MAIETEIATYGEGLPSGHQTLIVNHPRCDYIELDGPDAWALYQRLEEFIASSKTKFPEAILAFELDEDFGPDERDRPEAWHPHLFSPCCGADIEGVYAEQEVVTLDVEEVHDGTVWLSSGDGDGKTLLYVCANLSCYLGVSLPAELDPNWG